MIDDVTTTIGHSQLVSKLRQFMEDEARSCSMDIGLITPIYVYRMWGGKVAIDEIESAMKEIVESQ